MNRTHTRRQIDVNKPLIKVESADEFFTTENEEGDNVANERPGTYTKKSTVTSEAMPDASIAIPPPKKQEIIIPVTKTVEDAAKALENFEEILVKKRKLQTHFIRTSYIHPQPNPNAYEPSDKDLQFIEELNEKIPKTNKTSNQITTPNFAKTIEMWEIATDKNDIITLNKAQSTVESLFPVPVKDQVPKIYEYWKNLRESYQRPLLRKFWRVVNKDENNPNAAFRARENPRVKTRRAQRTNESENLEKMKLFHQDLEMVTVLLGNVRYREMLKMEMFDLAMMKFESSLREKSDNNKLAEKFKENYENEPYLKIRNKMKDYNKDAEKIIKDLNKAALPEIKPVEEPPVLKPTPKPSAVSVAPGSTAEELNFDLGSFIATIIDESLSKDITPAKVKSLVEPEPPLTNGAEAIPEKLPEFDRMTSLNKQMSRRDSIAPVLPSPGPSNIHEPISSTRIPVQQQKQLKTHTQPTPVHQPMMEEKSTGIAEYYVRKRIGRGKRVLIERIFKEDDQNRSFLHPKDYYAMNLSQRDTIITPEIEQKLPNANLREIYLDKFGGFRDICPFNDSEEENDMTEANKMIKNLATNFRNFIKQKRPVNPIMCFE